jgi:hypothetical protein
MRKDDMRNLTHAMVLCAMGLTAATASADSLYYATPGATFVPASQSSDGVQYWDLPSLSCEAQWTAGGVRVDAIENRDSDTYDSVTFQGEVWVMSPNGQWLQGHPNPDNWWSDLTMHNLAVSAPDCGQNAWSGWWMISVTGSGSFRPCDYIDAGGPKRRMCYAPVQFTVSASDWIYLH